MKSTREEGKRIAQILSQMSYSDKDLKEMVEFIAPVLGFFEEIGENITSSWLRQNLNVLINFQESREYYSKKERSA